jgi:hypothetical protein
MSKPTVRGYFQPVKDRLNNVMLIRVACEPCNRWHAHGDGSLDEDRTPVGELTHRSSHCVDPQNYPNGYWIEIQPDPYDPRWSAPRGKISTAYRRS